MEIEHFSIFEDLFFILLMAKVDLLSFLDLATLGKKGIAKTATCKINDEALKKLFPRFLLQLGEAKS